jgi:predicted kinase
MADSATLHLMVGLPCAGKTTLAKQLERQVQALRLSPDEWQTRLFGQDLDHPRHDWRHDSIEDLLWNVAAKVLGHNVDVILDFGFWKQIEREDYRARAATLGAGTVIHYLHVPEKVLLRRLDIRNDLMPDGTAYIPPDLLRDWIKLMEPPNEEELSWR